MLSVLVFELSCLFVEVLPYYIGWLLAVGLFESSVSFDHRHFLPLEGCLLTREGVNPLGSLLDHAQEVTDPVLAYRPLLGVVLHGQHLTHDGLLQNLNRLQSGSGFLQIATVHTLINMYNKVQRCNKRGKSLGESFISDLKRAELLLGQPSIVDSQFDRFKNLDGGVLETLILNLFQLRVEYTNQSLFLQLLVDTIRIHIV